MPARENSTRLRDPSRRAVMAAGLAAVANPALARFPQTVPPGLIFFVGNSFTRQHAIPAQVCRIATSTPTDIPVRCHPHTANGAWLDASIDFPRLLLAERGGPLPATIVLQDHSTAPLTRAGRQRSRDAIEAWSAAFEHTVFFETWPRRRGNALYEQRNMPTGPEEMAEIVHDHYVQQAIRLGASTAPIGLAWLEAETEDINLFAADGYHANAAGAWLAAMMLARAIGITDPYATQPPEGIDADTAEFLAEIADRHAFDPTSEPL